MKKSLLFASALAALAPSLNAQPSPAGGSSAASTTPAEKPAIERDLEAVFAIWRREAPAEVEGKPRELWKFRDQTMREFSASARAFAQKYPTDPRRFNGLIQSSFTRPWFILDFKPEFDTAARETNLIVDQAALEKYRAEQAVYLKEVILAPDAERRQRGGAIFALIADARAASRESGQPIDLASFRALSDRVIATLPDARAVVVVDEVLKLMRATSPEVADAYERDLQSTPIASAMKAVADEAKAAAAKEAEDAKLRAADLGKLKFTAADGREVDVASLKGKVVLIDFWATWCGPCIAELPNVVANYKKYHDKGFEVIGITLENPGAKPKDTPEQTAERLVAAKQKMLDFASKNEMPWPQYYDGKWWKNDYAVKYGIKAIPAVFLLDQNGNVASTEVRGPQLEVEIKRLLKL